MKSLKVLWVLIVIISGAALIPVWSVPAGTNNYMMLDTIYRQQSSTEEQPIVNGGCRKCCCRKHNANKEVPVGKNPNINNPDTLKNSINPEEVK